MPIGSTTPRGSRFAHPSAFAPAVAALALLFPASAWAESPQAAALRQKVTVEVVKKFAPEIQFHYQERFFPASAENLFKGATLYRVTDDHSTEAIEQHPINNPSELAQYRGPWRIRYASGNPCFKGGERKGNTILAPVYYSVRIPSDGSYVLICYRFLFGFNGPQSMRCHDGAQTFNYSMETMAEHEGDWEGCNVYLKPDLSAIFELRTEAHGNIHEWAGDDLDYVEGTHPKVCSACSSHAIYNGKYMNKDDVYTYENLKIASVIDAIAKADGPLWQPWKLPNGLRLFGKVDDRPVGELWAQYGGRMGTYKHNAPSHACRLDGGDLSVLQYAAASTHTEIFNLIQSKLDENIFHGMPCGGPGTREENGGEVPNLVDVSKMYRCVIWSRTGNNLVLSINPADPEGPVILRPRQNGDLAQEWNVAETSRGSKRFYIINAKTGESLIGHTGQGKWVTSVCRLLANEFATWTFSDYDRIRTFQNAENVAIRPVVTDSQNLNVLGNGPYKDGSRVGTWEWGRGAGNETWKIQWTNTTYVGGPANPNSFLPAIPGK